MKKQGTNSGRVAMLCVLGMVLGGCGGDGTIGSDAGLDSVAGTGGAGGAFGSGGKQGGGGAGGAAGKAGSGGAAGAGGSAGAGGAPGTGGKSGSGGTQGSGGKSGSGGALGSGGSNSACPSPALTSGDKNRTLQSGSSSRSYVLHVPTKYDGTKPVPLIIDFHGLGGNGSQERSSSPYPAQADPDGVIMAFPSGLAGPSGPAWNVGPCCVANTDDVAFAKALVADIAKVACIDTKRVYAVGFSMGGGMSHYLACKAADTFAAVAPAAFDLLEENATGCTPSRPVSVISFRSTGDGVVPYAGGYSPVVSGMPITFLGAQATFKKWAQINGCTGAASSADSNGCSTYSGCPSGVEVTLCTKQGGTHEAGNASVGWPALKKHSLP